MTTFNAKKSLNKTYQVDEIDIDVQRPIIDPNTNKNSKMFTPTIERHHHSHNNGNKVFQVEQVTIKKTKSSGPSPLNLISSESSTTIKKTTTTTTKITNFKNPTCPKVILSNLEHSTPESDIVREHDTPEPSPIPAATNESLPFETTTAKSRHHIEAESSLDNNANKIQQNSWQYGNATENPFEDSKDNEYYFRHSEIFSANDANNNETNRSDGNLGYLNSFCLDITEEKSVHDSGQGESDVTVIPSLKKEPSSKTTKIGINLDHLEFAFESYYLYVDCERYMDIFKKRAVDLESLIINGFEAKCIVLLTIPPECSDYVLLESLYGENVPLYPGRVQCCVHFRRDLLERSKDHLVKIGKHKFACLKQIVFGAKFPKHEFRANFNAKNN